MRDILKTLQDASWYEIWQEIFLPFLSISLIGYVAFFITYKLADWLLF